MPAENRTYPAFSPDAARRVVGEARDLVKRARQADGPLTGEQGVRAAVDAYVRAKTDEVLARTPIDVLNQGSRHFQLDALKANGLDTVLTVRDSPSWRLSRYKGMGRGVAYDLSTLADQYSRLVQANMRIRLSLDDESDESSRLVMALATYRHIQAAKQDLRRASTAIPDIEVLADNLDDIPHGIRWILLRRARKDHFRTAYDTLVALLSGEQGAALESSILGIHDAAYVGRPQARDEFANDPVGFVTALERVVPERFGADNGAYGLPDDLARKVASVEFSAEGLRAELRPYQEWGVRYALAQERVLLGDEMGLGKTIQALAVVVALRNRGMSRFVVVCPLSVLENWYREVRDKSDLRPMRVYGPDRMRQLDAWNSSWRGTIAITTYETVPRLGGRVGRIDCLVVDEAHYAKNPTTKRTQGVKSLTEASRYVLFMTGTALENRAEEMVSLISMLQPDVAEEARRGMGTPFAERYRNAVASVYYRRKREDVLDELPDLVETEEWCDMGKEERAAYVTALRQGFMAARRLSWNVGDLRLSSKARRLKEIADQAGDEDRRVLVFSFFRTTLEEVSSLLGDRCIGPINGSISVQERQRMVDDFDKAPAGTTLVAQIQAGGTGLNIQAASVVVICEPQYKPSIESQAISRAYRMGQTRSVFVHRLLCSDTIDQRITGILRQKQAIFDTYADESAAAASLDAAINQQTMAEMVREELAKYEGGDSSSTAQ